MFVSYTTTTEYGGKGGGGEEGAYRWKIGTERVDGALGGWGGGR